jgi:hypothetical protein
MQQRMRSWNLKMRLLQRQIRRREAFSWLELSLKDPQERLVERIDKRLREGLWVILRA